MGDNTPSTTDLYTVTLNFSTTKIFTRSLLASLTSKDAAIKKVSDFILNENEDFCNQTSPHIQSFLRNEHVNSRCVCVDDMIAFPNSIKNFYVETIQTRNRGTWDDRHGGESVVALHALRYPVTDIKEHSVHQNR